MGKPTGFLEYERRVSEEIAPLERIKNFNEFHIPLPLEKQQLQGARCMACGVPFCQYGKNDKRHGIRLSAEQPLPGME